MCNVCSNQFINGLYIIFVGKLHPYTLNLFYFHIRISALFRNIVFPDFFCELKILKKNVFLDAQDAEGHFVSDALETAS